MQVVGLWRYPVKSMGGKRLESAAVGDLGIDGDRRWGVYDVESATVLTARRTPELLFASLGASTVAITLPNGEAICSNDADRALSEWLGRSSGAMCRSRNHRWARNLRCSRASTVA